jgi:8-hydroxy-5-deazaflavin:NADPH oxidoreductase
MRGNGDHDLNIAIIGGAGHLGGALAKRLANAGHSIVIGSRVVEKARDAAIKIGHGVRGASNLEAAGAGEVIFVAVPFSAQEATLREIKPQLAGKIVVETTVPLVPPKVTRVQLPPEGSAALRAQAILGGSVRLVSAFHNVAAHKLVEDEPIECDVLVFGDDKDARAVVAQLAENVGLRGIHAGPLANSVAAEAMTSLLIFINKTYGVDGAGIKITGVLKDI